MVNFRFSAFADEYSSSFDEQIKGLLLNNVRMIEVRGVDGKNISDLTLCEAKAIAEKLKAAGIGVSAIGSPIGKIEIIDDMDAHIEKLRNTCEIAKILGTDRIRMFSFRIPNGQYAEYRDEVMARMKRMLDVADEYGVTLCHENEKGIYGDSPDRCLELITEFKGRLACIFDPANFIQCGEQPYPDCYNKLGEHIIYMHIKDALTDGTVVPAGKGVGGIPEILRELSSKRTGELGLTLEPHLRVFDGLASLEAEGERTNVLGTFATAAEAFEAAVSNLRLCLPEGSAEL